MSAVPSNVESVNSAPRFAAQTVSVAELLRCINQLQDQLVGEEKAYDQGVLDERKRVAAQIDSLSTKVRLGL